MASNETPNSVRVYDSHERHRQTQMKSGPQADFVFYRVLRPVERVDKHKCCPYANISAPPQPNDMRRAYRSLVVGGRPMEFPVPFDALVCEAYLRMEWSTSRLG
jgi:hypothetical protein